MIAMSRAPYPPLGLSDRCPRCERYTSPSCHMRAWMSHMKFCCGPITDPGRQMRM